MEDDEGNFVCPECKTKNLKIAHSLVLGPDYRSDDRLLQIIKCSTCDFEGIAIYEESRRGSFDSESWSHVGYKVSDEILQKTRIAIDNKDTKIDISALTGDEFFNLIQ